MNKLCLLPSLGLLKISGKESAEFLQGQITADVKQCPEISPLGAHCLPNGKIVFLFRLFLWEESYYLLMPQSMLAIAYQSLNKYAAFSECTISIISTKLLSILGAIGTETCSAITNNRPPPSEGILLNLHETDPRSIFIGNPTGINTTLHEAKELSGKEEDWHHLSLLNGIPTLCPETSSLFLPHRIGLPLIRAISFDKGCYVGQEIIARTQYRATPKHKVMYFQSKAPLKLTAGKVIDPSNKEIGICINAQSYQKTTEGLSVMPIDTEENIVCNLEATSIRFSTPLYANMINHEKTA